MFHISLYYNLYYQKLVTLRIIIIVIIINIHLDWMEDKNNYNYFRLQLLVSNDDP